MSIVQELLRRAREDQPVYICEIRDAFEREGTRPFHVHARLYDGSVRRYALKVPACADAEEARFVEDYLNATLYNLLSAMGARGIDIYIDMGDAALRDYAGRLDDIFQVNVPIAGRRGYGRCLNVNQRTLDALTDGAEGFGFRVADLADEAEPEPVPEAPKGAPVFAALPKRAERGLLLGLDVGGTDIKAAASVDGRLCALREYDWDPARFARAEQLTGPLLLLARLLRAAACMEAEGLGDHVPREAFERGASDGAMAAAAEAMERELGEKLRGFDGIGLSFPDVVIRNRIVGGETAKTRGMRENPALDYEAQFAKITGLCDALRDYARPGGAVLCVNDGPMAAFTAAVEQAAAGRDLSKGFFAHSLGTDLGTGWILPDGSIPELPLEVYNFVIDLGSHGQRAYDADDVRSTRNVNTGLPGSLQKYAGQSGVFRLAAKRLPEAAPEAYRGAFARGLFAFDGPRLTVPAAPEDMRKPCLEYFMEQAEDRHSPCAELFREVGRALGATWRETEYLLAPACKARTLFGRLVKTPACFELIREGARRVAPDIALEAADESLANTPLMRQLAARPGASVAQFAQAVGAMHYACTGL